MIPSIRVAIVEDQEDLRESLSVLINRAEGFQCVGSFASAEAALARIPLLRPDVVLMDLELPEMNGIECVRQLKDRLPDLKIIVLTVEEDPREVFQALEAGATGYLVKRKSLAKVLEAVRDVHEGGAPMSSQIARLVVQTFHQRGRLKTEETALTEREREILELLAQGYRNDEIAQKLHISLSTAKAHLGSVYHKLHVRSRAGAVSKYWQAKRPEG